jgi:hypothetical protein
MKQKTNGSIVLPIIFLIVTVGILAAGGFFVYKTLQNGKMPSPVSLGNITNPLQKAQELVGGSSFPKATESDFSFIEDPIVRKFMVAQSNVTKYRTKSTSSGLGADQLITSEVQMTGDKFSMRTIRAENGKEVSHTIDIADTNYAKDYKDNTWWMEKAKPVPTITQEEAPKVMDWKAEDIKVDFEKNKPTFTKLGEENCGASAPTLTCYKYQEKSGEITSIIWFDKNQYLLRKQQSKFGEFDSTMEFSYDNISITPPSPTKAVPEGKSIWEMEAGIGSEINEGSGMPSAKDLESAKKLLKSMGESVEPTPPHDPYYPPEEVPSEDGSGVDAQM